MKSSQQHTGICREKGKNKWHSLFFDVRENRENTEVRRESETERVGGVGETTACISGREARGDRAIRASTWQDVTFGEQEEETGQI